MTLIALLVHPNPGNKSGIRIVAADELSNRRIFACDTTEYSERERRRSAAVAESIERLRKVGTIDTTLRSKRSVNCSERERERERESD